MEQLRVLTILEKRRETPDTATFVLKPDDGQPYPYRPGQYVPLIRQIFGKENRRAYSFSSCPGIDPNPAITVKRIPNGEFSNWLLHELNPGDSVWTAAPAGRFLLPERLPRRLVYVAAGSGITPVFSQIKSLLHGPKNRPGPNITLFYANRDSVHTIFKDQIDHWMAAYPDRFHCTYLFSREKNAANALYRHLNNELFERLLLQMENGPWPAGQRKGTHFYLCAPNALMRMARMTLRVLDMPEENIHTEAFVPDARLPKPPVDTSRTHRILVRNQAGELLDFQVYAGETILNGALRQHIPLPYTCKSGICLSCLARCRRGRVEMQFVEYTKTEGPGALINTCVGYPLTDEVELDFD